MFAVEQGIYIIFEQFKIELAKRLPDLGYFRLMTGAIKVMNQIRYGLTL